MLDKYSEYLLKNKSWQSTMFFSAFCGLIVYHKVFNLQKTTGSIVTSIGTAIFIYVLIDFFKFRKFLKDN